MNAKTLITTVTAALFATVAQAITSEEIAAALDVDPSIGTFSTGGDAEWYVVASGRTNESSCVRSGSIGNSQTSTLTFSFSSNSVAEASLLVVSVWKKVSSDSGDVLVAFGSRYADDATWRQISQSYVLLPGEALPRLSFSYTKDSSAASGSDCAWIDGMEISLMPILSKSDVVTVSNVKCQQRTPWNGKVDIDYTVTCDKEDADIWVYPVGYDKDSNQTMAIRTVEGEGVGAPVKAGTHRMTWTVTDDYPGFNSTAFTVKMMALVGAAPYMVVDLSGGVDAQSYPVSYLSSVPAGGWGEEYKTTKMVLRLIPAGWFMMGSPTDETGREDYEDQHGVVLTKPYYMGVFECTQKQYELVMGANPVGTAAYKGDARPVASVSYNNIRGSVNGSGWPTHDQVDANSFMGRLRSKANMLFDLPTEAQWEYACRAGSGQALYTGKSYSETAVNEIARTFFNSGKSSSYPSDNKGGFAYATTVGSYLENAWGLYDMLGNVLEICRDRWNCGLGFAGAADPKGSSTYYKNGLHTVRGGSWSSGTRCRSAWRNIDYRPYADSTFVDVGFRVYCSPVAQ